MSRLLYFIRQKFSPPTKPTTSFTGKTILITGATSGLGFEAAAKFAELDASLVILGARTPDKGAAAAAAIQARTGCGAERIQVWPLDMADYGSIKAFAGRAEGLQRLDAAVLNAGVFKVAFERGAYGWEETLQVNTLSTALLAVLLWPKLVASSSEGDTSEPSVLEFVASENYQRAEIPPSRRTAQNLLQTFNTPEAFGPSQQYAASKLFVMYIMQTLAARATRAAGDKPRVLVTSVCPGACSSNLSRGYNGLVAQATKAIMSALFLRTAEEGARTLVSGLTVGEKGHGGFWQHDRILPLGPLLSGPESEELRQRIWGEIVEALEKDVPEVAEAVKCL